MNEEWTHEIDLANLRNTPELEEALQQHPLARIIIDSVVQIEPYDGYHRISTSYAYRDWLMAAFHAIDPYFQKEDAYYVVLHNIESFLPPDTSERDLPGPVPIRSDNPALPGLPARPELRAQQERWAKMREMLEEIR